MITNWVSGGIVSCILNLSTRLKWMVSFMPHPPYPWGNSTRNNWIEGWVSHTPGLDVVVKRRESLPCPHRNWTPVIPASSAVTIMTELPGAFHIRNFQILFCEFINETWNFNQTYSFIQRKLMLKFKIVLRLIQM